MPRDAAKTSLSLNCKHISKFSSGIVLVNTLNTNWKAYLASGLAPSACSSDDQKCLKWCFDTLGTRRRDYRPHSVPEVLSSISFCFCFMFSPMIFCIFSVSQNVLLVLINQSVRCACANDNFRIK